MYQNLSTRHDWRVKIVMFDQSKQVERNLKRTSGNSWVCWGPEQGYRRCSSQALDFLKSCFRSVCSLVPTPSLAFPRFAFGAHAVDLHRSLSLVGGHAVDLWQVYAGYSIPGKKRPLLAWTGCRCGTDIFLFFFSFF